MISPFPPLMKKVSSVLGLIPLLTFFLIIIVMFLKDFPNQLDAYFVETVLRSCLMLIFAAALANFAALAILAMFRESEVGRYLYPLKESFEFLTALPLLETGIFSIAIFFTVPSFEGWVYFIALLQMTLAISHWQSVFRGPIRKMYEFAIMHRIPRARIFAVLFPYGMSAFIDYFFIVLKRALLPLVFILIVIDFKKIILPRLIDSGMSYQAFVMFLCLIVSLHLLTYKGEQA